MAASLKELPPEGGSHKGSGRPGHGIPQGAEARTGDSDINVDRRERNPRVCEFRRSSIRRFSSAKLRIDDFAPGSGLEEADTDVCRRAAVFERFSRERSLAVVQH